MKVRIFTALALCCMAIPLFALGEKEPAAQPTAAQPTAAQPTAAQPTELPARQIRIGALKGPSGIGMIHVFEYSGVLSQNTSLICEAVPAADNMVAKMTAGELDLAVLPVNLAVKLCNAGLPFQIAAVVGNGMVQFLTSDPELSDIAGLGGKTVHVAGQAATPDFLFRTLLKVSYPDPAAAPELNYQLPIPEIAASLVAGRIRYAVLPEPFATMARNGNPAVREPFSLDTLWQKQTGMASYPMTVLLVHRDLGRERPLAVKQLLDLYARSIQQVIADPFQAGTLVEKHDMGLKAGIAAAAIPKSNYVFIPADQAKSQIEALVRVFLDFAPASVGGKLPDESAYLSLP